MKDDGPKERKDAPRRVTPATVRAGAGTSDRPFGVLPALCTPLTESGAVDYDSLDRQIEYFVSANVHGVFALGTTAEGAFLRIEDKRETLLRVVAAASPDRRVYAALLQPTTDFALRELDELAGLGPDYFVAITPYYGRVGQGDIVAHYTAIAEHSPVPVLLYDIPSRTGNPIDLSTVLELAAHPNIAGIKNSTGDFVGFSRGLLESETEGFSWIQGDDYLDAPALMLGADGIVSGLSNVRVEPYVGIWRAAKRGDRALVVEWQRVILALHGVIYTCGGNVNAGVKAGVELSGRGARFMALRSQTPTDAQIAAAADALQQVDDMIAKLETEVDYAANR